MAIVTGTWRLRQLYDVAYFPIVVTIWLLGALGQLPRVKASTQNEGHERRYFYGSVWAVCDRAAGLVVTVESCLPRSTTADMFKLMVFVGDPRLRWQHGSPGPAAEDASDCAG